MSLAPNVYFFKHRLDSSFYFKASASIYCCLITDIFCAASMIEMKSDLHYLWTCLNLNRIFLNLSSSKVCFTTECLYSTRL